ncbi:MAG TPA: GNAT family N-acetyltransferase [Tepidisphaeraceae bacterium]|nr:GNAT family N-acetyltransferase [Tepidisphaeraceae bacterium]
MIIHPLPVSDLPAALRLSTQAGWNHIEADLRRLLALWPKGYFGGYVDGKLVATTTLATYGAHVGWVGLVLVDEAHRRRGYAGQILDAMLEAAEEMGVKTLGLDATELGRPLYLARGFRDVATIDRWVRPPQNSGSAIIASSGAPLSEDARKDSSVWKDILALDLGATRVDRGTLLNHFRTEPAIICRTVEESSAGSLLAWAMLRPGRLGRHIAPVVADSESAAQAVVDSLLVEADARERSPVFIDVPAGQLSGWLKSRGFAVARSVVRMQAGIHGPDLLGAKIYAGCGFELG